MTKEQEDRETKDWISCADKLPRTGRRVLVTCLNGIHQWVTVAEYYPAGQLDATNWDEPPEDWWDEDEGVCANPEAGWWEAPVEGETRWELTGVSHWMPLPPQPNAEVRDAADRKL